MTANARSLVDLVIPTYHRPDLLARAVDSALSETPFLVTVLDDNSPEPAEETLNVGQLNTVYDGRLRVIRNSLNLGASLNILRAFEVSRAPYTWPFADDHVVLPEASDAVLRAITEHPDAAILLWHSGLPAQEKFCIEDVADFVELIERGRSVFGFSDVHLNRVVMSDIGRRYTRLDAHFSHGQPTIGIQIASLADELPTQVRGGALAKAQPGAASGWSTSYAHRFRLDPAYLIPDARLRRRYRAVVAHHFPWRAALIDAPDEQRGSIDEAFAVDAATLIAYSKIPRWLRAEARIALFFRISRFGRILTRILPRKRGGDRHPVEFDETTW